MSAQAPPQNRAAFSRRELAKLAAAVEAIEDPERLEAELRIADLEEQIRALKAKARSSVRRAYREGQRQGLSEWSEETARWRRAYEAMRDILTHSGPNGNLERLDAIMREWVGKA